METRTILDGNAFYEIDEDCLDQRRKEHERKSQKEKSREQSLRKMQKNNKRNRKS